MKRSIVVPVYGSAACLPELARRDDREVAPYFQSYELILVNDASADSSGETIVALA